jgi:hypothetical protein
MKHVSPQSIPATITEYNGNMVSSEHSLAPFTYATVADYYKVLNPTWLTWLTAPLSDPSDGVTTHAAGFALMNYVAQQTISEVSAQR